MVAEQGIQRDLAADPAQTDPDARRAPERWEALERSWTGRSRRLRPSTSTGRSRSGPRTPSRAPPRPEAGPPPDLGAGRARPVALGRHRYQWLHVVAFVQPTSGEAVWYLCSGLSKPFFEALLAGFARKTGAGRERHIVLVLDNAGWHGPKGLAVPEGISLVFLPPYSPELQPAEHLWPLVDEPVANRHFATLADLEAVIAERCRRLDAETIKPHTDFHWWPKPIRPN